MNSSIYIFLDGARCGIEAIEAAEELSTGHFSSLYLLSNDTQHLATVAPYIVTYGDALKSWYYENGWGKSWGLLIFSDKDFEEVKLHFRKFLKIKTEKQQALLFRFYDPRVLKVFLPTCDKQQILEFFGPVEYFIVEGDTQEAAILFKHKNGELIEENIRASKVFGQVTESKVSERTTEEKATEVKQPEEIQEGKRPPRRFIY